MCCVYFCVIPQHVYYKNERMGRARPVNLAANDRKPPRAPAPQTSAGALVLPARTQPQTQTQLQLQPQTQTPEVSS
jgi:hypothetical protein